jgi:hypothetical protein
MGPWWASQAYRLGLATWLLVMPVAAVAQDPTTALPASLLRRLAEVADGQGIAREVYIVAQHAFPHNVVGIFTTRAQAELRARRSDGLGVFGPFQPTVGELPPPRFFPYGCRHDGTTSMWEYCPDRLIIPLAEVVNVTITTRLRNGDSISVTVPAMSMDAIFFTLDALDKFAFPYYTRLVGVAEAAQMRNAVVNRLREGGR